MRGGVRLRHCSLLLFNFVLQLVFLLNIQQAAAHGSKCDRSPEGHLADRSDPEGRFAIRYSGSPGSYEPGEIYTVSLQGSRQFQVPQKFTGFMLTVEPEGTEPGESSEIDSSIRNVGTFQLFGDALTKFSETCPNTVTHTSSITKSDVQVLWNAPPPGSGCLVFRSVVVEHRDIWYMDDGPLSLTVCEDVHENLDEQPEVMDKCCACDEAKYEVTFEGLWSRHTHPKDFPSNGWLTRFSDLIGATHTSEYKFWEYGGVASEGLRQVAERGNTRMLESELKAESEHIRTIIKARGISYPNVTGKTFAVFRVDRKHHLMSLVSMIDPSPDWIVGVSSLELCLRNCSWVEFKVLNLYPWDAGTDSGMTYISTDLPTTPRDPIRQITSKWPKEEEGPFYDPMGEDMKPFARLYLTRQRLYEKSCSDDSISTDEDDSSQQSDCLVGDWSDWTPCSVSCGKGIKHRQRFYLNPMRAEMMLCRRQLTSRATCFGRQRTCSYYDYKHGEDGSEAILDDPQCAVSVWSRWSSCSATCGKGVRTRSRKYLHKMGRKRCGHLPSAPPLQQTDECELDECDWEDTSGGRGEEQVENNEKCPMTEWSDWGPCSVTCGLGTKMRTRLKSASQEVIMSGSQQEYPEDGGEECANQENMQQVQCEGEFQNCDVVQDQAKEMCHLPKDEGRCKGRVERWYFDTNLESCQPFEYSGCRGNRNNFVTKKQCETVCNFTVEPSEPPSTLNGENLRPGPYGQFESGSQVLDHNVSVGVQPETLTRITVESYTSNYDVIHCEVTRWSRWSTCSSTCGKGTKQRSRSILVHPQNGGRACPKKLLKFKKCKLRNCDGAAPGEDEGREDGQGGGASSKESNETAPTWGGAGPDHSQCILSSWTPWSPCSTSCGLNAYMQRTRYVIHAPPGVHCGHRIETRPCNLLPCKF